MKIKISSRCLFLLAIASISVWPALADDSALYSGNRWSFIESRKAIAAAAGVTVDIYPDCDEATVDRKMVRVYRPDGTGESQDESYTKVLTEKGKRNNRTVALGFMLPYFTVALVKLELIKPDGTVMPVDIAANSKEMIDDSQMGMNIYDPNTKLLQVNIPQLDIGDVVHAITRATTHRSIIPGEFAEYNVLEGQAYIRHINYEVYSPVDKPLKRLVLRDEIPGTVVHTTEPQPGESGT